MQGNLFIVSAPSGAGKTSLVRELLVRDARVHLSVSFTTRPARPGELEGRDYHFVSQQDFEERLARGEFLESARVHGNYYGTSRRWIDEKMLAGRDILLEIDWQGAQQVRRLMPHGIGIFILPPSVTELERRLTGRGQDSAEVIAGRLAAAREEMSHAGEFDYVIINDSFDDAVIDMCSVVRAARLTVARQLAQFADLIR